MYTEYLLCDDRRDWKAVENICEGFPDLDAGSSLTLVMEAIDAGNVRTFMVSPKQKEIIWVFEFIAEE